MNFKKILFLFLALLLPVIIFLFLKQFGSNQFDVPPLFLEAFEKPSGCSSYEYAAPYAISDTSLAELDWSKNDSLTIVLFDAASVEDGKKMSIQQIRLRTEFPDEKLSVVKSNAVILRNCIFLLKQGDNAVMIDAKRRIRGQYNLLDLEEADRLIMEIKIILRKY